MPDLQNFPVVSGSSTPDNGVLAQLILLTVLAASLSDTSLPGLSTGEVIQGKVKLSFVFKRPKITFALRRTN